MRTEPRTGGFDVVLGNPPWERVKLQEKEFFATRDEQVAGAKNAAARKKLIKRLEQSNPQLAVEWSAAQRRAGGESHLMRNSGAFPLGGVGDVNTYAVFADLFRRVISCTGRLGIILPNGLVTGFTYRAFLDHLLDTRTLVSFFGFENEDKLFPAVHNETKFGLLTVSGESRPIERIDFTAHIRQPRSIDDPSRRYSLTVTQIEQINPNTKSIPMFRLAGDAAVSAVIHSAAPVLVGKRIGAKDVSPWNVRFQRMFDMANDSSLFVDDSNIQPRIDRREGVVAVLDDGSEVVPLYEGKMFWHFNHRYGTYEGQTERQANKGVLPRVSDELLARPAYRVQPRYWVSKSDLRRAMGEEYGRGWLIAWRDVGISERTFILSPIPATAVGHNAPVIYAHGDGVAIAAFTGLLSSLLVDYDARQKSYRMTYFVVEQLAVQTPAQLDRTIPWIGGSAATWLARYVLELCYTSYELKGMAEDAGYDGPPFVWDAMRRAALQAELDAGVMHLYGLSRHHAEWVLDSFSVLQKYEERDHGEFRTKRLVLEAFDRIATAEEGEVVYHSLLDPPPGPPQADDGSVLAVTEWDLDSWPSNIHHPSKRASPIPIRIEAGRQIAYVLLLLDLWHVPVSKPVLERALVLMFNDDARSTLRGRTPATSTTHEPGSLGEFVRGINGLYTHIVNSGWATTVGQTGLQIAPSGTARLANAPTSDRDIAREVVGIATTINNDERFVAAVAEVSNERYELVPT